MCVCVCVCVCVEHIYYNVYMCVCVCVCVCSHLIEQVDGFIGKVAEIDVTVGERSGVFDDLYNSIVFYREYAYYYTLYIYVCSRRIDKVGGLIVV